MPQPTDSLTGRIALLAGARGERASAIARALTAAGARVVALDVAPRDVAGLEAQLDAAEREGPPFGVLVHAPPLEPTEDLAGTTLEAWRALVDATLTAAFVLTRAAARRMIAAGNGGAVVYVASTLGHRARPRAVAASAAAGGLLNLARALAIDLAPHGIRVNSVSPAHDAAGSQLPRVAEAERVADAVVFLASGAAALTTGTDLRVDGGALATWGDGWGARGA